MRVVESSEFKLRNRRKNLTNNKRDLATYILFMAWPILQFIIFYILVNANSFLLVFQENVGGTHYVFAEKPFENLLIAIKDFFGDKYRPYLIGSLTMFLLTCLIGTPLSLFFSYYIYKKLPGHNGFRVMLFLPSIISATVLAIMFKHFADNALPRIVTFFLGDQALPEDFTGYFTTKPFQTVCFFNIFVGFGTNVLMYSNKMSTIDPSIPEAARIDGASPFQEFLHIILPFVYPTFVVFFITGIGTLFVNQFNVMTFFGWFENQEVSIFGYKLFAMAAAKDYTQYPYLSSLGIVLSLICIPVTLILRKVLLKYGPSEK